MPPRPKKITLDQTTGDLGALAMRQTAVVTLYHPAFPGEKRDTGFRIEIESLYSKAARHAATASRAPLKIVDGEIETAGESFSDSLLEQTIAVTRRWWKEGETTDTITLNGEEMQATPQNVRKVYENPELAWIQREVQADYLNLGRFFDLPKTA